MKNLLLLALLFLTFLIGCKKDKDDDPVVEVKETPVVGYQRSVALWNQFASQEKYFYRINDSTFSKEGSYNFDLAFAYQSSLKKYLVASPISEALKDKYKLKNITITSTWQTKFYKLQNTFRGADFDTLKSIDALKKVVENGELIKIELSKSVGVESDEYGWSKGTMWGIIKNDGKYGIIKIREQPTGSFDSLGNIELEIKYEK